MMERPRKNLRHDRHAAARDTEYEPLTANDANDDDDDHAFLEDSTVLEPPMETPFSWVEYTIFVLLGIAMLWAWNMFLAAAPYFSSRLAGEPWLQANFQSSILAVATVTNLAVMLLLTHIQHTASYPYRINLALLINIIAFALLTASTVLFLDLSPRAYFAFLLAMVSVSAWATGLLQNGAFAFTGSFGRGEYMQALMAGQGIAGVLPPLAQLFSVLIFPPEQQQQQQQEGSGQDTEEGSSDPDPASGSSSAFLYFLTAVAISVITVVAFIPLVRRYNHIIEHRLANQMAESVNSIEEAERAARKNISLLRLFSKLRWLALSIALVFAESMFFPVFTAKITSVNSSDEDAGGGSIFFRPVAFIPLAFFFWNAGDLSGRVVASIPSPVRDRPIVLFFLTVLRALFIPMYLLCNIGGRGAVVSSDFFYLVVVQLMFGLTNGWLCSSSMIASGSWVEEGEREAAGGFMGLCLVIGLTMGSLLSFSVAGL